MRPVLQIVALLLGGAITLACPPSAAAETVDPKLLRYGEHLSQECTSCHRRDGVDNGIPSILGMKVADFVETMGYDQSGARPNQAMVSVASSLGAEQVKALAAYFASLPPPPKRASGTAAQR